MNSKIILISLFLSTFLVNFINAQCLSGDCQNGMGVYILKDGSKYVGVFQGGKATGNGHISYTDGSIYKGEVRKGRPHGLGIKKQTDGITKEGLWSKGRFEKKQIVPQAEWATKGQLGQTTCVSGDCQNGHGTLIMNDGSIYVGQFQNGEISGQGICYYTDGSKYQGQWLNRFPEGLGTKTFKTGKEWTGNWHRGVPLSPGGKPADLGGAQEEVAVQSGCILGNCINGKGIFTYPDGSKYEGSFWENQPNGQGVFYYSNGDQYIGGFKDGYCHGDGVLKQADGSEKRGFWKEGEFAGNASQKPKTVGCIEGDCSNGYGTYVFDTGERYIGDFKNYTLDGRGTVTYPNGDTYEGQFKGGRFNGFGTYFTKATGAKATGQWSGGTLMTNIAAQPVAKEEENSYPSIKVWAIVVGVSSYTHMPALRYPDDDAYRIYAFLKSPEGGAVPDEQMRILIDEDATKDDILGAMKEVFWQAGPNDLVLMYFSGHGLKGAFLPIDYDGRNNKLGHRELTEIIDKSKAKHKLFLADACHSGSFLAARNDRESLLSMYYNTLAQANGGTALIMSSKTNETSLESSGLRQGVFTHFLIKGLKGEADANRNKIVTVQELYNYVFERVRSYTRQQQSPIIKGDYDKTMTVAVKR